MAAKERRKHFGLSFIHILKTVRAFIVVGRDARF